MPHPRSPRNSGTEQSRAAKARIAAIAATERARSIAANEPPLSDEMLRDVAAILVAVRSRRTGKRENPEPVPLSRKDLTMPRKTVKPSDEWQRRRARYSVVVRQKPVDERA